MTATRNATQIDEIFNALDPETRTAFQQWQQSAAVAVKGRSLDLNDAFGNIGPFITDASSTLEILKGQKESVQGLVRDTGEVFEAVSERDQALAGAITGSEATFGALADADDALAESITILPTFQRESRLTLDRLDQFQADTRPLVQKLLPVANDISPTLDSVRRAVAQPGGASSATSIRSSTPPRTACPRSSASWAPKGSSRSLTRWIRSSRT